MSTPSPTPGRQSQAQYKVLLDAGIFIHSEYVEGRVTPKEIPPAGTIQLFELVRVPDDPNVEVQRQIDALGTVGRLIREGVIDAYTYGEISFEVFRGSSRHWWGALDGCKINECPAPLERSRFMQTVHLHEYVSKGGKKDAIWARLTTALARSHFSVGSMD